MSSGLFFVLAVCFSLLFSALFAVFRQRDMRMLGTQLVEIHGLVNSNLTEAMKSELEALERELALMDEVVSLRRQLGQEPTPVVLQVKAAAAKRIVDLRRNIGGR